MPGRDIIRMSIRELKRLKLVQEAIAKHVTQKAAAELLGLSERQVRRLVKAVARKERAGLYTAAEENPQIDSARM